MAKLTLGMDLGEGELKLALWDGAHVRSAVRVPMPDNLMRDGRIVSYDAMSDFIKEALRTSRLGGKNCALVLPAGQAYLRRVQLAPMTAEQLAVNLPYEFRDYLSASKDHYFYDYAVNHCVEDELGQPQQLDLTAAAVSKELIGEYRNMLRHAGLNLKTAIPAECAYANLLRAAGQAPDAPCCILDLGHTATRVHIFTGPCFETTRIIDCGLSTVDAAIADALDIDPHIARSHKEANLEGAQLIEPARNVYASIAVDIRKAMSFYAFNNQVAELTDAWYCGGGAYISTLLDTIVQTTDLNLHPISQLLPGGPGQGDPSCFAAAIGAAIQ